MKVVNESDIPANSNVIRSHIQYHRKVDGTLKARICRWDNHDLEKLNLRIGCPPILMEIFRLRISIAVEKGWSIVSLDASATFLQDNGFIRIIYIRLAREKTSKKSSGSFWHRLMGLLSLEDFGI